jgi:hypothetical protein
MSSISQICIKGGIKRRIYLEIRRHRSERHQANMSSAICNIPSTRLTLLRFIFSALYERAR